MNSGDQLGPWTLGRRLGVGGMGAVYEATDSTGSHAAVKMLLPALLNDRDAQRRFRREVSIAGSIDGPHVAEILGYDLASLQPWVATEYLDGPNLAEHVRSAGPLQGEELRTFVGQLAEGLRDLHAAGIVHRDIKPSNVVITTRGPVIIDFGVAAATEATAITAAGTRIGTAAWMAPEQIGGHPATSATDLFGFGMTANYAATGDNPFGTGPAEAMLQRIANDQPVLHNAPAYLIPLITRCLNKTPNLRPSAAEAAAMVDDMPVGTTVDTDSTQIQHPDFIVVDRVAPQIRRKLSRRGLATGAVAIASSVVIVAAGLAVGQALSPGVKSQPLASSTGPVRPVASPVAPAVSGVCAAVEWNQSWQQEPLLTPISVGGDPASVADVQRMVDYLNPAACLPVTGSYDSPTNSAVKAFQVANGLPPVNEVGPRTWDYLLYRMNQKAIPGQDITWSGGGASVTSLAEAQEELAGVDPAFIDYIASDLAHMKSQYGSGTADCPNTDTVTVYDPHGYADGYLGAPCSGGGVAVWTNHTTSHSWTLAWGGNGMVDCASLRRYRVPAALNPEHGGTCFNSAGAEVSYANP